MQPFASLNIRYVHNVQVFHTFSFSVEGLPTQKTSGCLQMQKKCTNNRRKCSSHHSIMLYVERSFRKSKRCSSKMCCVCGLAVKASLKKLFTSKRTEMLTK